MSYAKNCTNHFTIFNREVLQGKQESASGEVKWGEVLISALQGAEWVLGR